MSDSQKKISELDETALVEMAGHTIPGGLPSGESAQAQGELTRRLMGSIKSLDESTSKYSKGIIALTLVLLVIGVLQFAATIFGSPTSRLSQVVVFILAMGIIGWTFRKTIQEFLS